MDNALSRHSAGKLARIVDRRVVLETGVPTQKREIELANRAVSLLADDDLGLALVLALLVVDLIADK